MPCSVCGRSHVAGTCRDCLRDQRYQNQAKHDPVHPGLDDEAENSGHAYLDDTHHYCDICDQPFESKVELITHDHDQEDGASELATDGGQLSTPSHRLKEARKQLALALEGLEADGDEAAADFVRKALGCAQSGHVCLDGPSALDPSDPSTSDAVVPMLGHRGPLGEHITGPHPGAYEAYKTDSPEDSDQWRVHVRTDGNGGDE